MNDLSDLIEFENENTSLDFKAIQYIKENNEGFLKDIMSLANAVTKDNKYIIIGVKHHTNGSRELLGINENVIDDAQYQQLVDSNIEPPIGFKYFPYTYKDKTFGIIHIIDCSDPPYMMKKNLGKLKQGDSFIRKGSHNKPLTRKDIDNYFSNKKEPDISNDIFLSFSEDKNISELTIKRNQFEFPSSIEREKIKLILEQKEKSNSPIDNVTISHINAFEFTPYEKRSIHELKRNLKTVEEDFKKEDAYYFYEKNAHKINFYIHNNSSKFLEDVFVEVSIRDSDDFYICSNIYKKPKKYNPFKTLTPVVSTWEEQNYPTVEHQNGKYKIYNELNNIKHYLPTFGLLVPIRIVTSANKEVSMEFDIKIFAKNIIKPLSKSLNLKIVPS